MVNMSNVRHNIMFHLLPTGSEEKEVSGVGSIIAAILTSCQDMNPISLQLHEHEYSWVIKMRNTSEAELRSKYSPSLTRGSGTSI